MPDYNYDELTKCITDRANNVRKRNTHIGQEDLVQQGWLIALEALPYYDHSKGTLRSYLVSVLDRRLNRYVGITNSPVKISHRVSSPPGKEDIEDIICTSPILTPEQIVAKGEIMEKSFQILRTHLEGSANADEVPSCLLGELPKGLDTANKNRIYKAVSRAKRKLRQVSNLRHLFDALKAGSHDY